MLEISWLNSEHSKYFLDQKQKPTDLKTVWFAMDSTNGNNYPKILSLYIMYITGKRYLIVYYILFILFLNLTQDYKGGNVSSDVSGLEPAFHPLNQTFVVSWKGVMKTSIYRH